LDTLFIVSSKSYQNKIFILITPSAFLML